MGNSQDLYLHLNTGLVCPTQGQYLVLFVTQEAQQPMWSLPSESSGASLGALQDTLYLCRR